MNSTLVVLPRPSRFDNANSAILAGPARQLVDETLGPDQYDVCYAEDWNQNSQHTHVILTGQASLDRFVPNKTLSSTRGFVWHVGGRKLVATFWPQDCTDLRDYENSEEDEVDDTSTAKDDAPTARRNYRFWFRHDCEKLFNTPSARYTHNYNRVAPADGALILQSAQRSVLYFDSETHPETDTLQCFSFAINDGPVYTCGVYDWTGRLLPGAVEAVAALARAFSRNKVVAHNIFFDLGFLALFHGIPFGEDLEDTMLIGHRIWPEAEKSLAHMISLYINEPYHKSEGGTWHPRNFQQLDQLLRYNAKDVHTLREVYLAQQAYVEASPLRDCLSRSVRQVNESIFPYLYTSLHGLPVNAAKVLQYRQDRQQTFAQWQRIVATLAGYDLNPGSPQQVGAYFVEGLGYPILEKTDSGAPAMGEGIMYKYLLKFKNPIIRAMLRYKRARKVAGELGFKPWMPIKGR